MELLQQHNVLVGADCREILVRMQRLLTAAQPERYTASFFGCGSPSVMAFSVLS